MHILKSACCAALMVLLLSTPALCDNSADAAAPTEMTAIQLAVAYQAGYLSVVGTACFQVYSSMGIIASDLSANRINGATALGALEQNALLLSVCQTSLDEIQGLTSPDDLRGVELLGRLEGMLAALGALHSSLVDAASVSRTDKAARDAAVKAVAAARAGVEAALEAYGKPLTT